jgi:hypothetical protein
LCWRCMQQQQAFLYIAGKLWLYKYSTNLDNGSQAHARQASLSLRLRVVLSYSFWLMFHSAGKAYIAFLDTVVGLHNGMATNKLVVSKAGF